jgi:uncharacterized Rmd1/YagE family protein
MTFCEKKLPKRLKITELAKISSLGMVTMLGTFQDDQIGRMFAYTYGVCYFWHILKITKEALI